jgi:small-conductance mechanosensitive channel
VEPSISIGYATPWRLVVALHHEAARRTAGVAAEPAPRIFKTRLSDFYIEYRMSADCPIDDAGARAETMSRLHGNILDVFNEHEIQVMSPHFLGDPDRPKVVPRAEWFKAPAKADEP